MALFIQPPADAFQDPTLADTCYLKEFGARTYSGYNYLGPGVVARIKRRHFEVCLKLARPHFGGRALDFGCADGVLLPSLARHFTSVVGVDIRPEFARTSQAVARNLKLTNVDVVCNQNLSFDALRERLAGRTFEAVFLLEVLEHVGQPGREYQDRCELVREVAGLLEPGGRIIISVPKMIGLPFLLQRMGLAVCRLRREPISLRELLAAGLLGRTDRLERRWRRDHLGFNHRKLDHALASEFRIRRRTGTFFQAIYEVERRSRP